MRNRNALIEKGAFGFLFLLVAGATIKSFGGIKTTKRKEERALDEEGKRQVALVGPECAQEESKSTDVSLDRKLEVKQPPRKPLG